MDADATDAEVLDSRAVVDRDSPAAIVDEADVAFASDAEVVVEGTGHRSQSHPQPAFINLTR